MRILVCVKPVLRGDAFAPFPERLCPGRESAALTFNPPDCAALEQAFRLKESCGGSVTVASVAPPSAENLLRELCALPADAVVLASDPLYAGSDSLATARILARLAGRLGGFDCILLGRRAIDGETGHVGPELAALLGILSCITNVTGECVRDGDAIRCARLLEDAVLTLRAPLPAVLTFCGGGHALRPPSLAGMRAARPVVRLSNVDLALPHDVVGLAGSPTVVAGMRPMHTPARAVRFIADAAEGAAAILEAVRQKTPPRPAPEQSPAGKGGGAVWVVSLEADPGAGAAAWELAFAVRMMGAVPAVVTLRGGDDAACARVLAARAAADAPDAILLPATIRGRCVAPYCAALLQTGLTADCTDLAIGDEGQLVATRPAFGGGVMAEIHSRARPAMATVRPGVFAADMAAPNAEAPDPFTPGGHVLPAPVVLDGGNGVTAVLQTVPLGEGGLRDARVLFAGGGGVGSREGFARLERIAARLGAGIGASRSAVDAGYAPYTRQVGQTGTTVRPDAYIAFGIAGAVQHLVGMRDAGIVVAVNNDRTAPIFSHADVGIVAPWRDVADALETLLAAESARD